MDFLLVLLLISAAQSALIVPGSLSPDKKWKILVKMDSTEGGYQVATRDLQFMPGAFASDYWHIESCLDSRVYWRPDSAYFVIQESSSGIHEEFDVVHQTADGYKALPFDRFKLMESTKLHPHHGAVQFDRWLPHNRMAVTVYGDLEDGQADFECRFVVDLKQSFKVLSYHVVEPKG